MKLDDNKVIVLTGGAGFIGSSLIRHLNDIGINQIVVFDTLGKTEKWKNLVGKKIVDIFDKNHLFDWLEGRFDSIQSIIHMGACSNTLETDGNYLLENNTRYSIRLAEYALKHDKRFIYASSASTYGDGKQGFSDNEKELDKLEPLNLYGFSKHLFDLWAKNQGVLDKLVGLKYFNVFGPNEFHKGRMASGITHIVPTVLKEGVIRLFKSDELTKFLNGDQKRDFIYVKDAARITCSFLDNDAAGIFNIGSGVASTWNQLAAAVFQTLKIKGHIEYIDMPQDLKGKYQNYSLADTQKIKKLLEKKALCMPLNDSVNDYINNYLLPKKTW